MIPIRWLIAVMLLLLSVLNYIDRQALSILATTIQRELSLSDGDYAKVGQAFLLCYTLAYLASGQIVDRIGPRLAETAFVVTGGLGLVLAGVWCLIYRAPAEHRWVGEKEAEKLRAHGLLDAGAATAPPPPLRELLRWKPLWLILGVRMLTDPVWSFYLVWFAKYLQEVRGYFTLAIDCQYPNLAADIIAPRHDFTAGWMTPPTQPGLGVTPDPALLAAHRTDLIPNPYLDPKRPQWFTTKPAY